MSLKSCPWPCCSSFSTSHLAGSHNFAVRLVSSPWPLSRPPPNSLPPAPTELLVLDSLSQGQPHWLPHWEEEARDPDPVTRPDPPEPPFALSPPHLGSSHPTPPALTAPSPLSFPQPWPSCSLNLYNLFLQPCSSIILSYLVHCPDLCSHPSNLLSAWPQRGLSTYILTPPLLTTFPWLPSAHQETSLPFSSLTGSLAWSGLH